MTKGFRVILIAVAGVLSLPSISYASDALPLTEGLIKPDAVFFEFPVPDFDDDRNDIECPSPSIYGPDDIHMLKAKKLSFDQNGNIFWNETKIADSELQGKLESDIEADGLTELHIQPSQNAPAGSVIRALKVITNSGFPCAGFIGNEQYRQIGRAKTAQTPPWILKTIDLSPPLERKKAVPPITVQIVSTDSEGRLHHDPGFEGFATTGHCRAFYGEKPVSNSELYEQASEAMRDAFDRAGGEEKSQNGELNFEDLPDSVILTTPNTPWRCVGGAVFNLQVSGFISVGFALMPELN